MNYMISAGISMIIHLNFILPLIFIGLRGQVFGVWNFHVSQSSDTVNLF